MYRIFFSNSDRHKAGKEIHLFPMGIMGTNGLNRISTISTIIMMLPMCHPSFLSCTSFRNENINSIILT